MLPTLSQSCGRVVVLGVRVEFGLSIIAGGRIDCLWFCSQIRGNWRPYRHSSRWASANKSVDCGSRNTRARFRPIHLYCAVIGSASPIHSLSSGIYNGVAGDMQGFW